MKDSILLKGNAHGLSLFINEDSTIEQIKEELKNKLESARSFFGANKVTLSFSGKTIVDQEQEELLTIFQNHSDLDIMCVMDESQDVIDLKDAITKELEDAVTENVTKEIESKYSSNIQDLEEAIASLESEKERLHSKIKELETSEAKKLSLQKEDTVTFHNSTLRSGQQVIENHSVIIMGDVNNGARVEAGGNVIILGKLSGVVHAGLRSESNSYVIALEMKPVQLRIHDAYGRAADVDKKKRSGIEPKIAFVHNGMIAIEKIDNKVLKEIRG